MRKRFLRATATVFSLAVLIQFPACSSAHQSNLKDLTFTKKPTNKFLTLAEENFAKEWKSKFNETATELERNRNLWKQNQVTDYDFVIAKSAPGHTSEWNRLPVLIKIRNDEKISIEKFEKDKDRLIYSRTDGFEDFETIDKLLDYLRQEIENRKILEVKYHKNLGYPESIVIVDSFDIHGYRNIFVKNVEVIRNV